jgi:tRNA isopentenyl-2-thiomethyl-A-37 hydroxylase MiaE
MTDDLVKRLRSLAEEEFEMLNNVHEPVQEAANRIEELEAALRFAAGMISTMPPFDMDHPEETLEWIMQEGVARMEKKDD